MVALADRPLPGLASITPRGVAHGVARVWFSGPFYPRTLKGRPPSQLLFVAEDPWPGESDRGKAILEGDYRFAGQTHAGGTFPWRPAGASPGWIAAMHGFEWLRDLQALGGDAARQLGREAIASWIETQPSWRRDSWAPDVTARRLIAWLTQVRFLFPETEDALARPFLDSLARQARHLRRTLPILPPGPERLRVVNALIHAGLCLGGSPRRLSRLIGSVVPEIDAQLDAAGGHLSRSPRILFETLQQAIAIRDLLKSDELNLPAGLDAEIGRMAPMVRFLRHADGGFALFHDTDEGAGWLTDVVLTRSNVRGQAPVSAPESGYQRVVAGRSLVLMDTAAPPTAASGFDRWCHAGPLSFELSIGKERFITNCGATVGASQDWLAAQRSTAAHSTVTVDDQNAVALRPAGGTTGPGALVSAERREDNGHVVIDGMLHSYGALGDVTLSRQLYVAASGTDIRGEDVIEGTDTHRIAVRFHLFPGVQASAVQGGDTVLLRTVGGEGWQVRVSGGVVSVQESVYLGQPGEQRRSEQVVISSGLGEGRTVVKWAISRVETDK